jgi:triosephosphate isomerase (TIM)
MKTLIVGNWKMHLDPEASALLVKRLQDKIKPHRSVEVVVAPSFIALELLSKQIDKKILRLGAQNAFYKDEGAFTGEVSFTMLRGLVDYVIIGHSERRIYFGESLDMIRDKVQAAVRNELTPILCIGETGEERSAGETKRVIHDQLTTALANLTAEDIEDIVIAYEPVWAISSFGGKLAKPDDIQKVLVLIRSYIKDLYGEKAAESVKLLYGGSVDADLAPGYLALEDCNGALVGNASLNYHRFADIVAAAVRQHSKGEKDGD